MHRGSGPRCGTLRPAQPYVTSTFDNLDQAIHGIKVKSTTLAGSSVALPLVVKRDAEAVKR